MRVKNVNNKTPVRKNRNLKTKKQTPVNKKVSPAKKRNIKRMISRWNTVRLYKRRKKFT